MIKHYRALCTLGSEPEKIGPRQQAVAWLNTVFAVTKNRGGEHRLPPPSSPDCQSDLENGFYGPNNPQFDISIILLTLIIWKLQKEGWIWKLQKEGWGAPPSPPSTSPDCQSDLENGFYGPKKPQFDISTFFLTQIIWNLQKRLSPYVKT